MSADTVSTVLAWLVTYALHSTLLLACAWVLTRLPRLAAPRVAEGLWRTALFGGVLTASVHVFAGAPLWRAPLVQPASAAPPPPVATAPVDVAPVPVPTEVKPTMAPAPLPAAAPAPVASSAARGKAAWLLLLWPAGCAWLWLRRRRGRRRLVRGLAARRGLESAPLKALLRGLERRAGLSGRVRLTTSATLASPIAFGVARLEVCLPERALEALDAPHLEVMIAHEVAHLARRDPLWLRAYRLLGTVLFFQPLNHLAVSRLRDASEMLCDAWAAGTEPRRVALAECLTIVADWIVGAAPPEGAPAMARKASKLGVRVRRLLEAPAGETRAPWRALALLPLLLVAAFAPGLRAVAAAAPARAALETTTPDDDDPFAALDAELALLVGEVDEVTTLLARAHRPELARRLGDRLGGLLARRDALRRALGREAGR